MTATIHYLQGDALQLALRTDYDVLIHGCNCFCTMGAGIALQIKKRFPEAYLADFRTVKGDRDKLGSFSLAMVGTKSSPLTVVNAYTQFYWGRKNPPQENYEAIAAALSKVAAHFPDSRFIMPRIGAGLAGGSWEKIEAIIHHSMPGCEVTVVDYQP